MAGYGERKSKEEIKDYKASHRTMQSHDNSINSKHVELRIKL